ncbi:hepatocellular carcinoma-associated antigen 59-domain-containing protein [Aspergillus pseudodeflectus]|uniref:Hepatocellular carcinoma-associated antigen 59-domain-containing protein n=1 Tax=Aspergillus pseudodeflectus TaxID=176178 RepID=A0ABR4JQE7_9EURO
MDTQVDPNQEVLFRPFKRRKFQRRRPDDTESQPESPASNDAPVTQDPQSDVETIQTADALRLRRLQRSRKGGIEFSATSRPTAGQANKTSLPTAIAEDTEGDRLRAMCDRFTAHTGQTVDVDKHMMDYIESELAKRYRQGLPGDTPGLDAIDRRAVDSTLPTSELPEREPAALGKLHEIDLGQEARLRNIARTEEATRRLNGDDDELSTSRSPSKPPRYRKRRTSQDIMRDRLVEEVLRESKLDVYDEPEGEEAAADDLAADDRVAEQFRREFMDAMQSRRRMPRTKPATKQTEAPKGPKLGGSRSARAAMREMQEKGSRK